MKIKFTKSVTVPASDNREELRFVEGSVYDLVGPSAYRWVRRNLAVYYDKKPAAKVAPKLVLNRPMMGVENIDLVSDSMPTEAERKELAEYINPPKKKAGRPKKAKKDPGVTPKNIGPALPVTGSGKSGGPGWDDA